MSTVRMCDMWVGFFVIHKVGNVDILSATSYMIHCSDEHLI